MGDVGILVDALVDGEELGGNRLFGLYLTHN